jgi:hypothetical protein
LAAGAVGVDGAAFGLSDNSTTYVYDLLIRANDRAVNGVLNGGNQALISETAALFEAINSAGHISS